MVGTWSVPATNMTEIIYKDETTHTWPRSTPVDQNAAFAGFCIGNFCYYSGEKGGTGFIVKLLPDATCIGLALTAAHAFIQGAEYLPKRVEFLLGSETFIAEPLKKSLKWDVESLYLIDPKSNSKISVPDD